MDQGVTDGSSSRQDLAAVVVAIVLTLAAIGAWAWLKPDTTDPDSNRRAQLEAAVARQALLQKELDAIPAPDAAECPPDGGAAPPGSTAAESPSAAATPPLPAPPEAEGSAAPMNPAELAKVLEQATAIVIGVASDELSTGTGFFIGPNMLVTNRHVVEGGNGKRLFITSKALGSLRQASVLYLTKSSAIGSPDFALLRLEDGVAPRTLDVAYDITKLSNVVAAGYPSAVLQADANFRRLLNGDLSATPDLSLTQGTVQSFQSGDGGTPLIVHTASIGKGNSGGPLVDGCGRLVGINTFISVDQEQLSKLNFAIRSQVMVNFLKASGSGAKIDKRPCVAKG